MFEQLEHMKLWAMQNQDALTKEQICRAFVAMCDDAIAELAAAQPGHEADPLALDPIAREWKDEDDSWKNL